ncbi:antibiotic biosynthesis monooxygenase [Cohnella xylanilytica]|uniref:Antibiotic biosynthesis monooxygenase n=1 Tax=Cohnella xylanilytica TaxID=557555 RepID=A0A841U379_9BACL|nr:antibiotic biosynthesis monooxygenase [Cohnella xylanilytica]MBB6695005.1 antibiotic biosynthesis monooxygenase [Cohnella xylanilytica]
MIVATNTIRVKSGHVDAVAERFMNPKGVQHAPGFVRMELLKSSEEDYDELKVCTTWESREAFEGWLNSDAFKQAHAHAKPGGASAGAAGAQGGAAHGGASHGGAAHGGAAQQGQPSSVMLGSKLSVHEIVFSTPS